MRWYIRVVFVLLALAFMLAALALGSDKHLDWTAVPLALVCFLIGALFLFAASDHWSSE